MVHPRTFHHTSQAPRQINKHTVVLNRLGSVWILCQHQTGGPITGHYRYGSVGQRQPEYTHPVAAPNTRPQETGYDLCELVYQGEQ